MVSLCVPVIIPLGVIDNVCEDKRAHVGVSILHSDRSSEDTRAKILCHQNFKCWKPLSETHRRATSRT